MQDINLLQNKLKDRSASWDRKNTLITGLMSATLVGVLAFGGVLIYLNQDTKAQVVTVKTENASIKSKLESNQGDLAAAKGFQAQLQNIDQLAKSHVYWSGIFDLIQETALKKAEYKSITLKTDGRVHVEGITDGFNNLGKLVLSLSTNKDLHDTKLLSVQRSTGQQAGYTFSIDFSINQGLLTKK